MSRSHELSAAELESIRQAVARAEQRTSGEIVTYIVGRSDEYPEARWRGATLGAMLGVVVAAIVHRLGGFWGGDPLLWIALPSLLGLLAGLALVETVAPLKRLLIARSTLERRIERRALAAFVEEEVFNTRDRTGILLFLSTFEHRALVLGDEGISRQVEQAEWQGLIDDLVAGVRSGRAAESIVSAVERCGRLLLERDVHVQPDDVDELPDAPRVKDR